MKQSIPVLPPVPRLEEALEQCRESLAQAACWHSILPVPVLDRSWLQLRVYSVETVLHHYPVDSTAQAPELIRFRQLQERGLSCIEAERSCWDEFGTEACHQALQRYWQEKQKPSWLWSLDEYLTLISRYRRSFEERERTLPLLVLPRREERQQFHCHWI